MKYQDKTNSENTHPPLLYEPAQDGNLLNYCLFRINEHPELSPELLFNLGLSVEQTRSP